MALKPRKNSGGNSYDPVPVPQAKKPVSRPPVPPPVPTVEDDDVFSFDSAVEEQKLVTPSPPPEVARRKSTTPPVAAPPKVKAKAKGKAPAFDLGTVIGRPIVNMDERVITKKEKELVAKEWTGTRREARMDDLMLSVVAKQRSRGQERVFVGKDTHLLNVGIPMFAGRDAEAVMYPGCLPLEYLFGQDLFPLSSMIQLVSPPGVGKSGLVAEFGRWFILNSGVFGLHNTEDKFNDWWFKSFLGEMYETRTLVHQHDSVEDWQEGVVTLTNDMKAAMIGTKDKPGPGKSFPLLNAVDSVMGRLCRASQEKILGEKLVSGIRNNKGEGHAGRGFPVEALSITRWLKTYPVEMSNWPFTLILVNQLKMGKDDNDNPLRQKAGGEQIGFQESYELELKKLGGVQSKIECAEWEGYKVSIECFKTSFGRGRRRITTRLRWWDEIKDPATNTWEQVSVWDWDWSTTKLLLDLQDTKANLSAHTRGKLKEAGFHLEAVSSGDIENLAWSKSLGMKDKKEAVSWEEIGRRIRMDKELLKTIRRCLAIVSRPMLDGDYTKALAELLKDVP